MNITSVSINERVICVSSYYDWWQQTSPSFKDVLIKVLQECGSSEEPQITVKYRNNPPINEYLFNIHDVYVCIHKKHTKEPLEGDILTKMSCKSARRDWSFLGAKEEDLYIPYFQAFLSNLRTVWYDNKVS
mgnify:CR=1 FL=1